MNLDDKEEDADRRDVRRTKVLRNAKIIAPRRAFGHSLHRAEHHLGRRLPEAGEYLRCAGDFELTFELGRTRRPCRVIWRTDDKLGVAFEEAETAAAG